jgi:hypothetical protein
VSVIKGKLDTMKQTEIGVRRKLERSLKARFHETTWNTFIDDGYVRDHLEYLAGERQEMKFPELKDFARTALNRQHEHERELLEKWGVLEESDDGDAEGVVDTRKRPSPKTVRHTFDIELPEREQRRAAVLLEIQMRQAAARPDVARFRARHLKDRLLSANDAEAYFDPGLTEGITDQELAALGRDLARDYGWHREDSAWFVLTGDAPALRPLAVDVFTAESMYSPSYCRLTLHVAPWVPSEEVEKAFVWMRDQVRGAPGTVGEQRLEVLRFVEAERAKHGQRPSFRTLLEIWNRKYPHWSYGDYRAFSKAYREAHKEVVSPEYRSPRRAKTPNLERREARHFKRLEAFKEKAQAVYAEAIETS